MENRVIKFRAWQGIKSNGKKSMMKKRMIGWSEISRGWSFYEFQNAGLYDRILMQFTNLTDKNGVEIYEGDVLMYIGTNMSSMVVKFENGCFVGCGPFNALPLIDYINASDFQSIEVIGNVFENPELLNP